MTVARTLQRQPADQTRNNNSERRLPSRPHRLCRESTPSAMAGQCPYRPVVRAQLRRRRRALRTAWRQGVRSLPVRDGVSPAPAGRAQHEHGVALRIRKPCRGVAPAQAVPQERHSAHDLRRSDGRAASPGRNQGHGRRRPRDLQPRLSLDRLSVHGRGARARAHARGDPHPYRHRRRASAGLVHRPHRAEHSPAGARGRRLPL